MSLSERSDWDGGPTILFPAAGGAAPFANRARKLAWVRPPFAQFELEGQNSSAAEV
jgi:hypothetical protein